MSPTEPRIFVGLGVCSPQRIGAIEDDIACIGLEPGTLEQGAEPEALPLTDAAPALDTIMPRDLRAGRHGAEFYKRKFERLLDEAADHELPIGEFVLGVGNIGGVVGIARAVRPEVARDISLTVAHRPAARAAPLA